jgi:hypothetical protein
MSARVRRELREYQADLLSRIRRVTCPVCGAKPKQLCVQYDQKRDWCHRKRHLEAKFVGLVSGLTIAQRRKRECELAEEQKAS